MSGSTCPGYWPVSSAMILATRQPQVRPWHNPIPALVLRLTQVTVSQPSEIASTISRLETSSQRQMIRPLSASFAVMIDLLEA